MGLCECVLKKLAVAVREFKLISSDHLESISVATHLAEYQKMRCGRSTMQFQVYSYSMKSTQADRAPRFI